MQTSELTSTTPATASDVPRRVAVTLLAVSAFLAAKRAHLPFLEWEGASRLFAEMRAYASPVAIGVTPFVAGFLLVEILALVHPAWRPLRRDSPPGRRALTRAAWIVALSLATWQGFGHASFIQDMHDSYGHPIVEPGLGPALAITGALVAGTAATGCIASLVSRHGIGNGFAVLFAVAAAEAVFRTGRRMVLEQPPDAWSDVAKVVWLAVLVLVPLVLTHVRPAPRPPIPIPTCGLAAVAAPSVVFAFPARAAEWIPALAPVAAFVQAETWLGTFVDLVLTLVVAEVFARVFFPAQAVVDAFRRVEPGGPEAEGIARAALHAANRRSVGLVLGFAVIPAVTALLDFPVIVSTSTLLAVAVTITVASDLLAEVRARVRAPALVIGYVIRRMYLVEPALRALSAAGIVAFPRAKRYRMVLQFFAPWAPVEILVPADRAVEAAALCDRVAGAAS